MFEKAFNKLANLLDFFGRLIFWPFSRPLWRIHRRFDRLLIERPGFWGDLWRLFHRADWQRSARFSARVWVVGFAFFYPLARQLGHAWWINLGVSLGIDLGVYLFHKRRLWPERRVTYRRSYAAWGSFWGVTFAINLATALYLLEHTELGKAPSKMLLGVIGVFVNPWVFKFRDRCAIRDQGPKTEKA